MILSRITGIVVAAATAVCCTPSNVLAQRDLIPYCRADGKNIPTVLTVEGGGSLGVYEAGVTFALVEIFKRRRAAPDTTSALETFKRFCLSATTGASAGNINSFLAAVNWCDDRETASPELSTFWLAWVTTGLTQLFPRHAPDSVRKEGGLFTREHFRGYVNTHLREQWGGAKWITGCHVDFGATVTRLTADTVPGAGSIKARNQRMAFVLRIQGMASDSTPRMIMFSPDSSQFNFGSFVGLPPRDSTDPRAHRIRWQEAFELLQTSSGYPVAFQPLNIPYCVELRPKPGRYSRECNRDTSTMALDGGVFDNGPIALAYTLYFQANRQAMAPTAIYLSPDRRRMWRDQSARGAVAGTQLGAPAKPKPHGLESVLQLAKEAFPTARQYELQFAGRLLPTELVRRRMEREIETLEGEKDSLALTVARLCAARGGVQASQDCANAGRLDTARLRQSVTQQGAPAVSLATGVSARRPLPTLMSSAASMDSLFRSTERQHPLAGDWLAGFGAFIGRPLREYDFYVGIYDALVLLAENAPCEEQRLAEARAESQPQHLQSADSLRHTNAALKNCLAHYVGRYIENPPLDLGHVAPHVLRGLYADEFGRTLSAFSTGSAAADSAKVTTDAVRLAMRDAATFAASQPDSATSKGRCANSGPFDAMFCQQGVVTFFDALSGQRDAVEIMKQWRRSRDCREGRENNPGACRAERRFVDLIGDPEGRLYGMTSEFLGRIRDVTPEKTTARGIASGLVLLHGSAGDRHRRGFDFGRLSLPANTSPVPRAVYLMLPSSFGLTPNTAGPGVWGWELRRHLATSVFALSLPVTYRPKSEIGRDASGIDRDLLVHGLRLEHKDLWFSTRAGVQYDRWIQPRHGLWGRYVGDTWGVNLSVWGKLNLTMTGVPDGLPVYRERARVRPLKKPAVFTIGLGDANSLVGYWLFRGF